MTLFSAVWIVLNICIYNVILQKIKNDAYEEGDLLHSLFTEVAYFAAAEILLDDTYLDEKMLSWRCETADDFSWTVHNILDIYMFVLLIIQYSTKFRYTSTVRCIDWNWDQFTLYYIFNRIFCHHILMCQCKISKKNAITI